jgi:hypothetical protein
MTRDRQRFDIQFGKVTYAPGAPKNAPRWIWRYVCGRRECEDAVHGPFKTETEAVRDAEQTCLRVAAEIDRAKDERRTAIIQ